MERQTGLIIAGVVALLLVSVTLLSVAGLWFGYNLMQRQADATLTELVAPGTDSTSWNLDSGPSARGFGGPGMMWDRQNWGERPTGRGYGGPGMMTGAQVWDETPCSSVQNMPCDEVWKGSGRGGPGMRGGGWGNMLFPSAQDMPCGEGWQGFGPGGFGMMGPGMMGGNWNWDDMPCGNAYAASGEGEITSLEDAETVVHDYVERLGYSGLEVAEIMEFERNYYAILAEEDTGIGAMEVLVDKSSGAVGPEPGPNMMWNAKYGMHGGGRMGMMVGSASGEMTISSQEAEEITQRWLDSNLPRRTAGEADPFYGYYTLHFLNDGEIEGMLSVHGSSGDVWYHSWHGDFVAMVGGHD